MTDRRRNTFVLLIVAGLVILSLLVVVGIPGVVKPKKTRLGLDLKGGVELVYQGRPTAQSKVDAESLNRAIDIMRKRVDQLGVAQPEIQRTGADEIDVALPDVSNARRAQAQVGKTAQLFFYDWEPNVIGPDGKPAPDRTDRHRRCGTPARRRRADRVPGGAARRQTSGDHAQERHDVGAGLHAQAGGRVHLRQLVSARHQARKDAVQRRQADLRPRKPNRTCTRTATSRRRAPSRRRCASTPAPWSCRHGPSESAAGKVTQASPEQLVRDQRRPGADGGRHQESAAGHRRSPEARAARTSSSASPRTGKSVFQQVTKEIAQRGQEAQLPGVSKEAAQQHFAIVLDGQVITSPSIDYTKYPEGIDASTGSQISGGFTITSAENLADELQSGALPIKLDLISQSQVSATLGKQALSQGLIAGVLGFAVVCLFLLLFYRVLGAIAIGGLVIYGIYYFALIKLIPITLTLPGIAGLILTIGIAADANIVIFERVKEEIRGGRSIISGIATGYRRGFAAIVDANVVTFMTAFILFALATAEVKGFAFTLGIGTLLTLFTAVLATQAALGAMGRSRLVSHPAALGAARRGKGWTFDFMGASKWFFSLSGTILLVGALAIGGKGLNFGIDFKSGTRIQTAFVKPVNESQVAKR